MFNLGRFYFSKKELFLLIAALLLGLVVYLKYSLSFFDPFKLLILTIFTFLAKGFISTINDTPLFLVFLLSIFLTLYYPIFQVIIFYFLSFFFLKILKVI